MQQQQQDQTRTLLHYLKQNNLFIDMPFKLHGWRNAAQMHSLRFLTRLRVVSNFGDGNCGAGEIHTRAHAKFREDATRGEHQELETTDLAREFYLSQPSDFEV